MSNEPTDTAGTALAASTIVQGVLWHLIEAGLVPKEEILKLLERGIEGNRVGGPGNANAAAKITAIFQSIEAFDFKVPSKH